jgi:rRNA-processing protein FCF1
MQPSLKPGQDLGRAAEAIRSLEMEAVGLASGAAGQDFGVHRNGYLQWVERVDGCLHNLFFDGQPFASLRGEFFWQIRSLDENSPRAHELVNVELRRQSDALEVLRSAIDRLAGFLKERSGPLGVIDTQIFLHFQPIDQIDWTDLFCSEEVRLIIPMRVVEELDERKYRGPSEIAERARAAITRLRKDLTGPNPQVQIREGVSAEVYVEPEPRLRKTDADQEVLDLAYELSSVGADARLVTEDAGLELRARGLGVSVCRMPTKYLRRRPDA